MTFPHWLSFFKLFSTLNLNRHSIISPHYKTASHVSVCAHCQNLVCQSLDRQHLDHPPLKISSWLHRLVWLLPGLPNCPRHPKFSASPPGFLSYDRPTHRGSKLPLKLLHRISQPNIYRLIVTFHASKCVCFALTARLAIHVPSWINILRPSSSARCFIYSLSSFRPELKRSILPYARVILSHTLSCSR